MFRWLTNLFYQPHPVETYDEALRIAQYEVQKKFPMDYSLYNPNLWYDQQAGKWHFRYLIKHEPGEYLFGGIGPGVEIRKSDGKITYLKGQK